jgi:hypothetical protein
MVSLAVEPDDPKYFKARCPEAIVASAVATAFMPFPPFGLGVAH